MSKMRDREAPNDPREYLKTFFGTILMSFDVKIVQIGQKLADID